MGVNGLIPFVRKACPEAIRPLSNRFRDIKGKRIVIDGTLITQRLHFSPSPHPYRHVLGWYRICEELSENQISAICIFDGNGRHAAKFREIQRRKASQKQAVNRGQVEAQRTKRLEFVHNFLADLPSATGRDDELAKALESLRVPDTGFEKAYNKLSSQASPNALDALAKAEPDTQLPSLLPSSQGGKLVTLSAPLKAVYDSYRASVSLLASDTNAIKTAGSDSSSEEQITLTKAQNQLSVMERDLWTQISSLSVSRDYQKKETYHEIVSLSSSLLDQSCRMSVSFARRSNLPTVNTYHESKVILEAMGVTCIDSPGVAEGEAFASSIVLHGDADFVVSEDTDVLVYGAPLLRNITSSSEPLEVICSDTIQRKLQLDHSSFVDMILLMGTDFSQRIKNVGPNRAFQLIKKYGSIEHILESEPQYPPRTPVADYLDEIKAARAMFNRLPKAPDLGAIEHSSRSGEAITDALTRYKLGRYLMKTPHWTYESVLSGNYFHDNPSHAVLDDPIAVQHLEAQLSPSLEAVPASNAKHTTPDFGAQQVTQLRLLRGFAAANANNLTASYLIRRRP